MDATKKATAQLVGVGVCLAALGLLGWQAYAWLVSGVWVSIPLAAIWLHAKQPLPETTWIGAQSIINWILRTPLWVDGMILGALIFKGAE